MPGTRAGRRRTEGQSSVEKQSLRRRGCRPGPSFPIRGAFAPPPRPPRKGGSGCRNRPRACPPRFPPPGPSPRATGSSRRAAGKRRRRQGWLHCTPPPPASGLRGLPAVAPALPARDSPAPALWGGGGGCPSAGTPPRACGTWNPGCRALPRTRCPRPSCGRPGQPCGGSSLNSRGRRSAPLSAHASGDVAVARRPSPARAGRTNGAEGHGQVIRHH